MNDEDNINEHLTAGPVPLSLELSQTIRDLFSQEDLGNLRAQLAYLDSVGRVPATGDTIRVLRWHAVFVVRQRHWQLHPGHHKLWLCLDLVSESEDPYQNLPI